MKSLWTLWFALAVARVSAQEVERDVVCEFPAGPSFPDLLYVSLESQAGGETVVAITVSPEWDGEADLRIAASEGAIQGGETAVERLSLGRSPQPTVRRITVEAGPHETVTVEAELTLFNARGEQAAVLTETLDLGEKINDVADEMVSFVRTLPDGRQAIERLPRDEAENLEADGHGRIAIPRPQRDATEGTEVEDPRPVEVLW